MQYWRTLIIFGFVFFSSGCDKFTDRPGTDVVDLASKVSDLVEGRVDLVEGTLPTDAIYLICEPYASESYLEDDGFLGKMDIADETRKELIDLVTSQRLDTVARIQNRVLSRYALVSCSVSHSLRPNLLVIRGHYKLKRYQHDKWKDYPLIGEVN